MKQGVESAVARYQELNNSFRRKLVFHLGSSSGFFSQYNNMVLAMLYCLEHRIRFVLYSADAIFSVERGWRDWFLPFVPESSLRFHRYFNHRTQLEKQFESWRKMGPLDRLQGALSGATYLTYDIFDEARAEAKSGRTYSIPQLGIDGDVRQACRTLVGLTWRFNPETRRKVDQLIARLGLPAGYAGIHVRSGDKTSEAPPVPPETYLDLAAPKTLARSAFVATDDYTNVEQLRNAFPEWTFYTLAAENERGYDQASFSRNASTEQRREAVLSLLASMEILRRAKPFVGTFSSNIGMFLGMTMDPEDCLAVDASAWYVW